MRVSAVNTSKFNSLVPILVTAFIVMAEVAISFNSALMPNIKDDFNISNQLVQMTVAVGLFSLGLAGLLYGGLADVFGRRPVFLFSVTLFSLMALVCAYAPTIEIFLIGRFLQGVGAGAGWVVGNCCLNDLYSGKAYAKVMNYVHAIAGITPAVAPIAGAYLGYTVGWRNCFILVFAISTVLSILMYLFQKETLQQKRETNINKFIYDYKTIFNNKTFVFYGMVKVLAVMMIFCEIANLPLIFINYMSVSAKYYGLYMLPVFLCYIGATLLSSYLLRYWTIDKLLKLGLGLIFSSNLIIILLDSLGWYLTPITIQVIKSLSYAGWGFIFGNATAVIVNSVPGKSGMASALMISLEMLFSFIGIYFLGLFFNGTIIPLSYFLLAFAVIASVPLIYIRRAGYSIA